MSEGHELTESIEEKAATPFFKAVGGKRQLLPELRKHVPAKFGRYFEPFVGGGALFFDLCRVYEKVDACLTDANPHMMAAYATLRDHPGALIKMLGSMARAYEVDGEAYYYDIRANTPDPDRSPLPGAARFLFLNRTCFNGLWRVNSKGLFNVPHGKYTNPTVCPRETLLAASSALQGVSLLCGDFADPGSVHALRGDFWYADPPYWPVSATADFTSYTKGGFGPAEQERLRDLALKLKKKGVVVLLSNADVEPVRKLYAKGFELRRVEARRNINSAGKKRGAVGELLIW